MTVSSDRFPYLSIVATARNDNHGGDLLRRMQLFVDGLAAQCRRHALPAELVLVDWNPPADRAPLADALTWPASDGWLSARVLTVPAETHQRFNGADRLPLFQMIGKNAGIRRAQAPFVLATNIDLLFNDALMRHLARQRLRADRMYRVDRYDCDRDVPADADMDAKLAYCDANLLRVNRRECIEDRRTGERHTVYWRLTPRVWLLETLQDLNLLPVVTRKRVHVNASGDFTLMARDRWFALRGYAEFEMYSMHLDALLCMCAHFAGVREKFLGDPMRAYHIEHGSGWSPENEKALSDRLSAAGIEQLDHDQYHRWAIQMRRSGASMMFNDEAWGLRDDSLPERRVA